MEDESIPDRTAKTVLLKIVVMFQGLIDIRHKLFGQMAKLFDEPGLVNCPGLVDHHLRAGPQSSGAGGNFDLEGIDLCYI